VLTLARKQMPTVLAEGAEFAVGLMLIALGGLTFWRALLQGRGGTGSMHAHGSRWHVHGGAEDHVHLGRWALARRPLLVGMVHGLAGSGALTSLVLAHLATPLAQFSYMLLFGLGSIAGMALLSGLAGLPLSRISRRPLLARSLSAVAGLGSVGLGIAWDFSHAQAWLR
jgi:high-affinity nickel-transport protein